MANVRSYMPKKDTVVSILDDNNTDMAIFTESWLSSDINDTELLQANSPYTAFRRDRNGRKGGGVLVFTKSNIPSYQLPNNCAHEILCVHFSVPSRTYVLISCYRPPDSDSSFTNELHSVLLDITFKFPRASYILCGDFNFPEINWVNLTASSRQSKDFLDLALNFNLTQTVNFPTRGTNTLDLVLTSHPENIESLSPVDGLSDHSIVLFNLNISAPIRQRSIKLIRDYSKADTSRINSELNTFFEYLKETAYTRSVDENWRLYKQKLLSLISNYVPLVCIRGEMGRPWYTNLLKKLAQKKKRLFKVAKKSGTAPKWKNYFNCLREYNRLLKRSKKKFFHQDLLDILHGNPKKFWKILTPNRHQSHNITLTNPDGSHVPVAKRSDVLNSYFSSVFTCEPSTNIPALPRLDFTDMPAIEVTAEGIMNLIKKLKISSSPGPDNIPVKILKATDVISSQILQIIFTQSIREGTLPKDWKINKVAPVFKSGKRSDPTNYRPISLTCIACKLLEHIIYSHIANHLERNSFFFSNQHGFRPGLSCETQLFEFTTDLHLNLDSSFQTDVIYLDFSKAFDCVPHKRLVSKLSCLHLDPLILSWITCFLTDRVQFTCVGDRCSETTKVISGVPQGSVLGPLLFLIFINDLPTGISSPIRLFADDCVIYRRVTTTDDQSVLQKDLTLIAKWCSRWMMSLNVSKCKFMHVTRKRSITTFPYCLGTVNLSEVHSYRYLGVTITNKLNWSNHILKLTADASKSLNYLRRSLYLSPPSIRKIAYETFIRTKLEYASSIWNPHQTYLADILEAVQNRATRFISSKYGHTTSVTHLKASVGLPLLASRRKISLLCLFHKLYYNFPDLRSTLLFPPVRSSHRLFNSMSIQRLHGSTNAFNKSFLPVAIEQWNSLPESVVAEHNPSKFRELLSSYILN